MTAMLSATSPMWIYQIHRKIHCEGALAAQILGLTGKGAFAIPPHMQAAGEAGMPYNRAMRRRKARLQQGMVHSPAAGPIASKSGKQRMLETHAWHAKRMHMATR